MTDKLNLNTRDKEMRKSLNCGECCLQLILYAYHYIELHTISLNCITSTILTYCIYV